MDSENDVCLPQIIEMTVVLLRSGKFAGTAMASLIVLIGAKVNEMHGWKRCNGRHWQTCKQAKLGDPSNAIPIVPECRRAGIFSGRPFAMLPEMVVVPT